MNKKYPITKEGFQKLEEELYKCKNVTRKHIISKISEARALGDLSENAEYSAAKEAQAFNEAKIKDLEAQSSLAEIIDTDSLSGERIIFGAYVDLIEIFGNEEKSFTIRIVGNFEANADENLISISSPLARALIGKNIGDYIEIDIPKGRVGYDIVNVYFKK